MIFLIGKFGAREADARAEIKRRGPVRRLVAQDSHGDCEERRIDQDGADRQDQDFVLRLGIIHSLPNAERRGRFRANGPANGSTASL